ncbi:MAG TPA: DUF1697 domain-containing protein [Acidimicrobiales bacterium]|nr:DUF1697 domain-containing protein [Acidimicrobiales bacterium]
MPVYAALLRAINLGSRNKISMPDLRELFEAVGADEVRTHVQSGNVVFRSTERSPAKLVTAVEKRISADLGLDIRVLLRTKAEMAKIVAGSPFAGDADHATLHVTFLVDKPDPDRAAKIDPSKYEPDRYEVIGRDVHLHCPNGYGRSKLSNAFFEKKLDQVGTTRNWKTVTTLVEMTGAGG